MQPLSLGYIIEIVWIAGLSRRSLDHVLQIAALVRMQYLSACFGCLIQVLKTVQGNKSFVSVETDSVVQRGIASNLNSYVEYYCNYFMLYGSGEGDVFS